MENTQNTQKENIQLTQVEIEMAMQFDENQQKDYDVLRSMGFNPREAIFRVVDAYTPENIEKTRQRSVGNDPTLLEGVGKGIKTMFLGGFERTKEYWDKYGAYNALIRIPTTFAASVGRGFGEIVGAGLETIDDLLGERPSQAIGGVIQRGLETETGQKIYGSLKYADEASKGMISEALLDVPLLFPAVQSAKGLVGSAASLKNTLKAGKDAIKKTVSGGYKKVPIEMMETAEGVYEAVGKMSGGAKYTPGMPIGKKTPLGMKLTIPEGIRNPEVWTESINRGFSPQQAFVLGSLSNIDKTVGKNMLSIAEDVYMGKKGMVNRATDPIGENIVKNQIEPMVAALEKAGKGVDDVAKSLKGIKIEDMDLLEKEIDDVLSNYGIERIEKATKESINKAIKEIAGKERQLIFGESEFVLVENIQKEIEKAVEYILSPKKDAYDVHKIKKSLDTLIRPQKAGEGLQGQAKRLVQDLRRTVDDFLDIRFPEYNTANSRYHDLYNSLQLVEENIGGIGEPARAVQSIRRMFSNVTTRDKIKDTVAEMERAAGVLGIEGVGDVSNQLMLAEILIDMFGETAVTSLGGIVESAVSRATQVSRAFKNPIKVAGEVAGEGIEKLLGQTQADRLKFLKTLLGIY